MRTLFLLYIPRISLHFKLLLVQYLEYEYGLLTTNLPIIFQHMSSPVLFSMIYCIIFRSMHFCMIKSCRSEKKLSTRSFKEANLNKFDESLTLTGWLKPLKTDYPHESYNRFIKEYSKQLHASFSIKCIKGKQMISLVDSSHLKIYKSEKWPL